MHTPHSSTTTTLTVVGPYDHSCSSLVRTWPAVVLVHSGPTRSVSLVFLREKLLFALKVLLNRRFNVP